MVTRRKMPWSSWNLRRPGPLEGSFSWVPMSFDIQQPKEQRTYLFQTNVFEDFCAVPCPACCLNVVSHPVFRTWVSHSFSIVCVVRKSGTETGCFMMFHGISSIIQYPARRKRTRNSHQWMHMPSSTNVQALRGSYRWPHRFRGSSDLDLWRLHPFQACHLLQRACGSSWNAWTQQRLLQDLGWISAGLCHGIYGVSWVLRSVFCLFWGVRDVQKVWGWSGGGSHPILMMGWCCSNFETCLMKLIFTWLVVTGRWILWLSIQLGMSSSQLTNSIIFSERWRKTTNQLLMEGMFAEVPPALLTRAGWCGFVWAQNVSIESHGAESEVLVHQWSVFRDLLPTLRRRDPGSTQSLDFWRGH